MEEEKKIAIRQKLIELGLENKKINYDEFKKIHEEYASNTSEEEFSKLLNLSKSVFHNLKYRKDARAIILKNDKALEESKEEIIEELKKEGYRKNQLISYEEFKTLYIKYGKNLPEYKFANLLEITKTNFASMKSKNSRARILKDKQEEKNIEKEVKEKIKDNNLQNQLISYEEFEKLYNEFGKNLTQIQFANALGIKSSNLWCAKNRKTKMHILKTKLEDIPEKVDRLVEELKNKKYDGIFITYNQFMQLYNKYGKNLNQIQFAEILGINGENYYKIKNSTQRRARINFEMKEKLRVKKEIAESRFYTRDEIEKIIINQKIELNDFLRYAFNIKKGSELIELYRKALEDRNKLYIGATVMDKKFMNKHANELLEIAKSQSIKFGKNYRMMKDNKDVTSEILLMLMEKYGEISNNFEGAEAIEILTRISGKIAKYQYLKRAKIKTFKSLDEKIKNKDGKYYSNYKILEDKENEKDDMEEI